MVIQKSFAKFRKCFTLLLLLSVCSAFSFALDSGQKQDYDFSTNHGFEKNIGQFADENGKLVPDVLYRAALPQADIYITTRGISYCFIRHSKLKQLKADTAFVKEKFDKKHQLEWSLTKVNFINAIIDEKNIVAEYPLEGFSNYFFAHCKDGIVNVKSYKQITVKNIYPNIDWVIYFDKQGKVKYDFVVNPGADYKNIQLQYITPSVIQLNESSLSITIKSNLGEMTEGSLFTYDKLNGKEFESSYTLHKNDNAGVNNVYDIGFDIPDFDNTSTVVIDPPLVWATYYGGASFDGPRGMATDTAGNVYITGYSSGATPVFNPPGTTDYFQGGMVGVGNIIILKFDKNGIRKWATYYGGTEDDWGRAITTDVQGNIYVTGEAASPDMPVMNLAGAYNQASNSGGYDAFILKFGPLGNRIWASYYGGTIDDYGTSVVVDDINSQLYIVGLTNSTDFPTQTLAGAHSQTSTAMGDAFVAKFNQNLNLVWATYFGGDKTDAFYDVEIDKWGNAYIIGSTSSTDFPVNFLTGAYNQPTRSGVLTNSDVCIVKCSPSGALVWSTYFGGTGGESGSSLTTDNCGNIYVVGTTGSADFPTLSIGPGCFMQSALGGGVHQDAFIAKFLASGTLNWSTYLGGSTYEEAFSVATHKDGNLYITGKTASVDFPLHQPLTGYYQTTSGGSVDIFITGFDNLSGAMKWSTYYGGDDVDFSAAMSLDKMDGSIYITGELVSFNGVNTVNIGGGAYYQSGNGGIPVWGPDDGFVLKFTADAIPLITSTTNITHVSCYGAGDAVAIIIAANGAAPYSYLWNNSSTSNSLVSLTPGVYNFTVSDGYCNFTYDSVTITQPSLLTNTIVPGFNVCIGQSAMLNVGASGGTPGYNYLWNTGATGSSISLTPTASAGYVVTITDANGCTLSDSVIVTVSTPLLSLSADTVICSGNSAMLTAAGNLQGYAWSPSVSLSANTGTTVIAAPLLNTTYTVTGADANGCAINDFVTVVVSAVAPTVSSNIAIPAGSTTTLAAGGGVSYSWSPSIGLNCDKCSHPVASPSITTTYFVTVVNTYGCTGIDSVTVEVIPECANVYLPTAFSPNNDGQNDVLQVYGAQLLEHFYIQIFDRWGERIFETGDISFVWDGTYKGQDKNTDTFMYKLEMKCPSGEYVYKTGNIYLLR